jgi:hypothetical protein
LFKWGMSMTACHVEFMTMTAKKIQQRRSVFYWGDKRFGDDWPAPHLPARSLQWQAGLSRPKKVVSPAQGFRSGKAGLGKYRRNLSPTHCSTSQNPEISSSALCLPISALRLLISDLRPLSFVPVLRTPGRKPSAENAGQAYSRNCWKNLANRKKIIIAVPASR